MRVRVRVRLKVGVRVGAWVTVRFRSGSRLGWGLWLGLEIRPDHLGLRHLCFPPIDLVMVKS